MDRVDLALLLSRRATILESRSGFPDAPVIPPRPRRRWFRRRPAHEGGARRSSMNGGQPPGPVTSRPERDAD